MLKCPFDQTKVFCSTVASCESLGFTMTTTQCAGRKTNVCPTDATKVSCDTSAIVGEIRLWATATPPKGWKICDGTAISKTTYSALYAVIGNTYNRTTACVETVYLNTADSRISTTRPKTGTLQCSDTATTFYLPDLKGRVAMGVGMAHLITHNLASRGGESAATLTINEIPAHAHNYTSPVPSGSHPGGSNGYDRPNGTQTLTSVATGGGKYHENRMPFLTLNYIIYTGVY